MSQSGLDAVANLVPISLQSRVHPKDHGADLSKTEDDRRGSRQNSRGGSADGTSRSAAVHPTTFLSTGQIQIEQIAGVDFAGLEQFGTIVTSYDVR